LRNCPLNEWDKPYNPPEEEKWTNLLLNKANLTQADCQPAYGGSLPMREDQERSD
jgi:hypothetical protein